MIRIFLHDNGERLEGVWATPAGKGLYKIESVPFLHMAPTCGDVVEAAPDPARGSDLVAVRTKKKGGRWVAVYNWYAQPGATAREVVARLHDAAKKKQLVVESCLEPKDGVAGCVYIAAPKQATPAQVDGIVDGAGAPADFLRVLPVRAAPKRKKTKLKKKKR